MKIRQKKVMWSMVTTLVIDELCYKEICFQEFKSNHTKLFTKIVISTYLLFNALAKDKIKTLNLSWLL